MTVKRDDVYFVHGVSQRITKSTFSQRESVNAVSSISETHSDCEMNFHKRIQLVNLIVHHSS